MKVTTITLNGVTISLRLTAANLATYAETIGSSGNTLFAVMDALDDIQKQGELFSAALTYKGHSNTVTDGQELIDMMADAEYEPIQKKELIVQLAEQSGVIGKVDSAKFLAAIKSGSDKICDTAVAILSFDESALTKEPKAENEPSENPT